MWTTVEDQILQNMGKKETRELLQIWINHDHEQWSDEAFEAVQQILTERGVVIPSISLKKYTPRPQALAVPRKRRDTTPQPEQKALPLTQEEIKRDIRGWGVGFLIVGAIHLIASGFLNPIWGAVIILLGLINLCVQHRVMYIVNGVAILVAGVMNLAWTGNSGWIVFGLFQLHWGISEIRKFGQLAEVS